jgi:hypothetical protein
MYVLHLSIYFCIEGEQKIDDREREGETERENGETAQQCSRRRERIITSFSLSLS